MKPVYVPLRSLPVGTRFELRSGTQGELIGLGIGSATVKVYRPRVSDFTPETGPQAGKRVRFVRETETTTWSLETAVRPVEEV